MSSPRALLQRLTTYQTLYFSHGFSPVFKDLTKVNVPKDIDVILVAPKGSGRTVRSLFREGRGINSSFAVYQDVTGKAEEKAQALGVAIGSGYLYKTSFENEVYSDLYGERGCLMGGIHGMFLAQYEVLRERGHSPSEAFNETVEEATQSLYPLIGANGMDWMYEACSTTARRGAIDWTPKFKDALKPVFNQLYDSVKNGTETTRSLEYNGQKDYRQKFEQEMEEIRDMEIWRAGKAVRYAIYTCVYADFHLICYYIACLLTNSTSIPGLSARKTRSEPKEALVGSGGLDSSGNVGDFVLCKSRFSQSGGCPKVLLLLARVSLSIVTILQPIASSAIGGPVSYYFWRRCLCLLVSFFLSFCSLFATQELHKVTAPVSLFEKHRPTTGPPPPKRIDIGISPWPTSPPASP